MKRQSNLGLAHRAAQAIRNEGEPQLTRVQQLLADPETRISDETGQAIHDAAAALAAQAPRVVKNVKARWSRGRSLRLSTPVRKRK